MKHSLKESWRSFLRLVRFLAWYAAFVALMFILLPAAGVVLEENYEALDATARFGAVLSFFVVIAAWQVLSMHDRRRRPRATQRSSRV